MDDQLFFNVNFFDIFKFKSADLTQFFLFLFAENKITRTEQPQAEFYRIRRNDAQGLHAAHGFDLTGGAHKGHALQPFFDQGVKFFDLGVG